MQIDDIISVLTNGGVVVLRTDTIYGILARAHDQAAVERIYAIKDRQAHKPFIQLITSPKHMYGNSHLVKQHLERYSDRPTSIIIETPDAPKYLVRNGTSLGYRFEKEGLLYHIIQQTGPLVAPSANPEGMPPARSITEAKHYFGSAVDLYIDNGEVPSDIQPSRIIKINPDGTVVTLRD